MNSEEAVPYIWSECQPPSDRVLKVWSEVGNKLDKESTGESRGEVISGDMGNSSYFSHARFCWNE